MCPLWFKFLSQIMSEKAYWLLSWKKETILMYHLRFLLFSKGLYEDTNWKKKTGFNATFVVQVFLKKEAEIAYWISSWWKEAIHMLHLRHIFWWKSKSEQTHRSSAWGKKLSRYSKKWLNTNNGIIMFLKQVQILKSFWI